MQCSDVSRAKNGNCGMVIVAEDDLYDVLGVAPTATPAEISRAYRQLVRSLHPDTHPDDPTASVRLSRVTSAYRLLADPRQRARYDRLRSLAGETDSDIPERGQRIPVNFVPSPQADGLFFTSGYAPFGVRHARAAPRPRRGRDVVQDVTIDLVDVATGVTLTVGAAGQRRVRIPAGVDDGQQLRIRAAGDPSPDGGPPGDLYVVVHVRPHPRIRRRGDDLEVTIPITFPEAVSGTRIPLTLLRDEHVIVDVPAGTRSGQVLRQPGQGIRTPTHAGDLRVTVVIDVPTKLTAPQRTALRALATTLPDPRRAAGDSATA
jgi:molecular chaperone DnaJ